MFEEQTGWIIIDAMVCAILAVYVDQIINKIDRLITNEIKLWF